MNKVTTPGSVPMSTIVRNFKNEIYRFPQWQRDLVWPKGKQTQWIEDVKKGGYLPGVLILFNIEGENIKSKGQDVFWCNDGAQRTLTLLNNIRNLEKTLGKECLDITLDNAHMFIQTITYSSQREAFLDFFRINRGTSCSVYEACKGIITNGLEDYQNVWFNRVKELHEVCNRVISSIGCKQQNERNTAQKRLRDDFGLFVRFVEKDDLPSNYKAGAQKIQDDCLTNQDKLDKLIESRFQKILSTLGPDGFDKQFKLFKIHIENNIAEYIESWNRILADGKAKFPEKWNNINTPTPTNARFWLAVSIFRKNKGISKTKFDEFTCKYLSITQGGTTATGSGGGRQKVVAGLSNLNILNGLCQNIEVNDFINPTKRQRRDVSRIKSGYHISHEKSFSKHGEGLTFVEPAISNMSRGAQDL